MNEENENNYRSDVLKELRTEVPFTEEGNRLGIKQMQKWLKAHERTKYDRRMFDDILLMNRQELVTFLIDILKDEDESIRGKTTDLRSAAALPRRYAALWVGYLGEDAISAIPELIKATKNKDTTLIGRALKSLVRIGIYNKEVRDAFREALLHKDYNVKFIAAKYIVLIQNEPQKAFSELINIAKIEGYKLSNSAIDTLAFIGKRDEVIRNKIKSLNKKSDSATKKATSLILEKIGIQDTIAKIDKDVKNIKSISDSFEEKILKHLEGELQDDFLILIKEYKTKIKELEYEIKELNEKNRKLYENTVKTLLGKERSDINIDFLKKEFINLLDNKKLTQKGRALEEFSKSFFNESDGLEVVQRGAKTKSEEIDLVIKNNARRPYWTQLQSPNIFVECKYWKDPVGAEEIKKFKDKLEDHKDRTKIGFFIALNGFTKGVEHELAKLQTRGLTIGLIAKEDFQYFFESDVTVLEFLEDIISKSMM